MRRLFVLMVLASWVGAPGLAVRGGETEVPLDEVPEAVIQAALEAVPGIELVSAEVEEENGETVYELVGTLGGERHEIEVTPDGDVVEIETGEDDEEDEEGEEDEDGEDDN